MQHGGASEAVLAVFTEAVLSPHCGSPGAPTAPASASTLQISGDY